VKGFDSCRLIKKGLIGESALSSPSGKNPISRVYRHSPPSGRISAAEGLTPSGENPCSGIVLSGENPNRMLRHSPPSRENPNSRRTDSK